MEVYIVVYHDSYRHSECEGDCCNAETTEVKGVTISRGLAEELIKKSGGNGEYRKDFDILPFELEAGCGVVIVE
jgi:hypothetical protein